MKIRAADVPLDSRHTAEQRRETRESRRIRCARHCSPGASRPSRGRPRRGNDFAALADEASGGLRPVYPFRYR
jgi:hypothetical protein